MFPGVGCPDQPHLRERQLTLKIYTKTGDQGETGLLGGIRVSKTHLGVEACGCLDETSCWIGSVLSEEVPAEIRQLLTQIQNDLFDLGSRVAACSSQTTQAAEFPESRIQQLEQWVDRLQVDLPELTAFILPGGNRAGAGLHLSRSVCRRAERRLVELIETQPQRNLDVELIYLNRLGDLLFVLARAVNHAAGVPETQWLVTRS